MPPHVLLVFPRFLQDSFWSLAETCAIWGARSVAPPLGLLTVAALLPPGWSLRLVDRNVRDLSADDWAWADLVMTGGMLPQRPDALEIIRLAQAHGKPVAVGGPDTMSSPEVYAHADFQVLGEAEGLVGDLVKAWEGGVRRGVFEATRGSVDMTQSPLPRFDLVDFRDYLYVGVQFSRGCPFTCEFCDIIELYGRVPRAKSNAQMLEELGALHRAGYRGHVDFVDDNLIGNRRALKRFLPELITWQRAHGYPFRFSTEASLNLADDVELLALLRDANFFALFTGIESPDEETLIRASKKQNTRRDIAASVHRLQAAGMFVIAGFIVGFDSERGSVAEGMLDCIEQAGIPVCMVGLLTALPETRLARRLEAEGRLRPLVVSTAAATADQCTAGLNFVTLRPRQRILADYRAVLSGAYAPAAYFRRIRALADRLVRPPNRERFEAAVVRRSLRALGRILWRLHVRQPALALPFWRTVLAVAVRNPAALEFVLIQVAFFLHLGPFSRHVIGYLDREIAVAGFEDLPARGAVAGATP